MTEPRSLAEAFTTELAFDKGAVPIRLRVSARAQRVALRIDGRGQAVELVLPRRTPLVSGLKFLDANRDWVEARLKDLPVRVPFADGVQVPFLGVKHRIRHVKRRVPGNGPVWIEEPPPCAPLTSRPSALNRRSSPFFTSRARHRDMATATTKAAIPPAAAIKPPVTKMSCA